MMNKVGLVLGVAAIATLAGCKDPNYKSKRVKIQDEPKIVVPEDSSPKTVKPVPVEQPAEEVKVVEEVKIVEPAPQPIPVTDAKRPLPPPHPANDVKPAEPAAVTTTYIVQRGDYLAKISRRFNVTIASIKKANPSIKNDVVKIGQKLQIPGKHEIGEQKVPAGAIALAPQVRQPAKPEYKPYVGSTRIYEVQKGDTLGKIAYSNGINIRQLKELNGLSDNNIRIGQKLKIPAAAAAAAKAADKSVKGDEAQAGKDEAQAGEVKAIAKPADATPSAKAEDVSSAIVETAAPDAPEASATVPAEPSADTQSGEGISHVVQEGEDITGLAIKFSTDPASIRQLNNLSETDEDLTPGMIIKIPAGE